MKQSQLTHTGYIVVCLALCTLLGACTKPRELPPTPYACTPRMNSALQECLKLNSELTYWELHINKIIDYQHQIGSTALLYGGTTPLSPSPSGISVQGGKNTHIYVYSGMEAYCYPETPAEWPDEPQAKKTLQKFWLIKDQGDRQLQVIPADSSLQSPFKAIPRYIRPEELQAQSVYDSLSRKHPVTHLH